ncbi:MAG: CocE/NonD family hydrolase [Flavobacteriales bacterium]|nr:CocE/NonD family hydrolase [Flavobacteriales bacterium]
MNQLSIKNFKKRKNFLYGSAYIQISEDLELAIDIFLPRIAKEGDKFPSVVNFVRYVRTLELKWPFRFIQDPLFGHVKKKEVDYLTKHGYAFIIVDLRGSGASTGFRDMEFSPNEVNDMNQVLDWIVSQHWSDGKTATTGVSYTGTTAEFSLSTKHSSIKACCVRSGIFDLFEDITYPGGVRHLDFVDIWKYTTRNLDLNNPGIFGPLAKIAVKGIKPVQSDKQSKKLKKAVEGHNENYDFLSALVKVNSRNEKLPGLDYVGDDFSPHTRINDVIESKVPILRISGWYDGALADSAIKGALTIPNTEKTIIGPWDHGPIENIDPFVASNKLQYNVYEQMVNFFDKHMKGVEKPDNKDGRIQYFTLGKGEFRSTNHWPPEKSRPIDLFLSPGKMSKDSEPNSYETKYTCDYEVSSGKSGRWNSLTDLYRNGEIRYDNRREITQKLLTFTSEPMDQDTEITGIPSVKLFIKGDAKDFNLFVYLDDVFPDKNQMNYITEGLLRFSHRSVTTREKAYSYGFVNRSFDKNDVAEYEPGTIEKITIPFCSISYLVKKGHRIQFSIATADKGKFDSSYSEAKEISVYTGANMSSKLILPVVQ